MKPCPADNSHPMPSTDAWLFDTPTIPFATPESYDNDTDGARPPNAGGIAIGTEYENSPRFPATCHEPEFDNDVFANDPTFDDNTSNDPFPEDVDVDPTDIVAVNTPASTSFDTSASPNGRPHVAEPDRATAAEQFTCANVNRDAQSPPIAARNAE